VRGSKVVGAKLFTTKGEQMGTIDDVLLDPKSGRVSYGVLGIGGFLGMGEKRTIVPWNLIQQDRQNPENFVTHAEKQKLQQAPSFQGDDQWGSVTQPDYLKTVQAHFSGASAQGQQAPGPQQQPSQDAKQQQQQQQQAQQTAQQEEQKRAQEQAQQQAQAAQKKVQDAQKALDQAKQEEQKAKEAQQQSGTATPTPPGQ
jgi:hypothetical protein